MNLSIEDINGDILVVSQFTLWRCAKGKDRVFPIQPIKKKQIGFMSLM